MLAFFVVKSFVFELSAEELNKLGFNCIVNSILENNATNEEKEKGFDLADYLLKFKIDDFRDHGKHKIITFTEKQVTKLQEINPLITSLIQRFDLYTPV